MEGSDEQPASNEARRSVKGRNGRKLLIESVIRYPSLPPLVFSQRKQQTPFSPNRPSICWSVSLLSFLS